MYNIALIPAQDGLGLGMGVNLLTGEAKTSLVNPGNPLTFSGDDAGGGLNPKELSVSTSVLVGSQQDYSSLLTLVTSASGRAWTEDGEVSMSASASYLQSQRYSASQTSFVVANIVTTEYSAPTHDQLSAMKLPQAALDLASSDPNAFVAQYGTHFVVGFTYGGAFIGSVTLRSGSIADRQRLKTNLSVEYNDFEMANGKFTADFAATLSTANTWYKFNQSHKLIGAAQGSYPLDTIDQMQSFLDSHFMSQLNNNGAGDTVAAVCYSWDMLEDVHTIPGYSPGLLTLGVDQTVMDMIVEESRKLDYAKATALDMQDTASYVGGRGAADLQAAYVAIEQSKQALEELETNVSELQQLTPQSAQQYLTADNHLQELAEIEQGRTALGAVYYLDGAFSPNTTEQPNEAGQWQQSGVFPTDPSVMPSAIILSPTHGSRQSAELGYCYHLPSPNPEDLPLSAQPPTLAQQVALQAYMVVPGTSTATLGDPLDGAARGVYSTATWSRYPFNKVGFYWG